MVVVVVVVVVDVVVSAAALQTLSMQNPPVLQKPRCSLKMKWSEHDQENIDHPSYSLVTIATNIKDWLAETVRTVRYWDAETAWATVAHVLSYVTWVAQTIDRLNTGGIWRQIVFVWGCRSVQLVTFSCADIIQTDQGISTSSKTLEITKVFLVKL